MYTRTKNNNPRRYCIVYCARGVRRRPETIGRYLTVHCIRIIRTVFGTDFLPFVLFFSFLSLVPALRCVCT